MRLHDARTSCAFGVELSADVRATLTQRLAAPAAPNTEGRLSALQYLNAAAQTSGPLLGCLHYAADWRAWFPTVPYLDRVQ